MNELFCQIKSISRKLQTLTTAHKSSGCPKAAAEMATLQTLQQSVTDTLRLFMDHGDHVDDADDVDLHGDLGEHPADDTVLDDEHQPTTPPNDDMAADNETISPKKRRKTSSVASNNRCGSRNSARVAEKCLPDCLQSITHPSIKDYKNTKIGSFMAANIMVMNLQKLQPKAEVVAMISRGAVLLLHEVLVSEPDVLAKGGLANLTAASFWILAKFGGVRALTPDASLMSMCAGIQKSDLFEAEVLILNALNWDVCEALKKHNHLDELVL